MIDNGAEIAESEVGEAGAAADSAAADRTVLRKKGFVDAVAAASGQKKAVVRPVVEAVLDELGKALLRGESLVLPPLGRVSVSRAREKGGSDVLVLRLRRSREGAAAGKAETAGAVEEAE